MTEITVVVGLRKNSIHTNTTNSAAHEETQAKCNMAHLTGVIRFISVITELLNFSVERSFIFQM